MEALWSANGPKGVVGILDTVFVKNGKCGHWYFTCKTGEVLKKRSNTYADIIDRFTRVSLSNERNVNLHVCLARCANGMSFLWDQATLHQAFVQNFENTPDIIALQVQ
jgi:hypothetical protein